MDRTNHIYMTAEGEKKQVEQTHGPKFLSHHYILPVTWHLERSDT